MGYRATVTATQPKPMGDPIEVRFHGYGDTKLKALADAKDTMRLARATPLGEPEFEEIS